MTGELDWNKFVSGFLFWSGRGEKIARFVIMRRA